ncbi:MAG: HMA2 domain-containing protein [Methylocella sp.]
MTTAPSSPPAAGASSASATEPRQTARIANAREGAAPKSVDAKRTKGSATKLKLHVAHQVPGRVRMKVASAKGNPELLKQIGETFGTIPGIERVSVNPATGSVVLHYDTDRHDEFHGGLKRHYQSAGIQCCSPPNTEIDVLANKIAGEADFLAQNSRSAKAVVDIFKKFDLEIKLASGNMVDLKIVLALGIIGITVFEVGASAATPIWLTLTIFTVNHAIEMHQPYGQSAAVSAPVVIKTR